MSNLRQDLYHDRPETPNSAKSASVDSLLASELNKLTFRERESINEEIHGIDVDRKYVEESGSTEDTPEILTKSFLDLEIELENLRSTNSDVGGSAFAFNRSQELFGSIPENGTYLNTNEIRIMFLRCERFDCQKAAKRICGFADLMYELYGDVGLERRTRLSDLDDDEILIMKKGLSQIMAGRDRAGRRIYTHFASDSWKFLPVITRLRHTTYLIMSLLMSDVVSQQRGVVFVMWYHNAKKMDLTDFIARGTVHSRGSSCMPMRIGAVHYCFPSLESSQSESFGHIISRLAGQIKPHLRIHTGKLLRPLSVRERARCGLLSFVPKFCFVHSQSKLTALNFDLAYFVLGSAIECMYILESFGISCKQVPLNISGDQLDLTNHNRVLELCAAREKNPKLYKNIIECPTHSDILFGRGQIVMNYPGNSMFRNFIQSNLDVFSKVQSKKESTQWTWRAVRTLKNQYGARFLKEERIESERDIMVWVEVPNEIARSKVRIAFRDARKRLAKSTEKETNNNSKCNGCASGTKANTNSSRDEAPPPPPLEPSSSMSKRKSGIIMALDNFILLAPTQPQLQQCNLSKMNFEGFNDNLSELNNYNSSNSSSTSAFLGLDGSNSKRKRLCSRNFSDCWDSDVSVRGPCSIYEAQTN